MARKELTVQEEMAIAEAAADRSIDRTALADRLGMSRQWLSVLIGRVRSESWDGLKPRSRAPKRTRQIGADVEDRIVRIRKELAAEGMSAGPAVIRWHLEREGFEPVPSESTIWRRLKDRGLVRPMPERAPRPACVRFEFPAPNACWQIDFTHWPLRNGRPVVIVNVIDDHSRLCVASVAALRQSSQLAWQAFSIAATQWGVPAQLLSDNGVEFSSRAVDGGLFATNLREVGVDQIHSRAHHPQTCGKVERFHQTTKTFLTAHRACRSVTELQRHLDDWVERYNHRPHQGIARRTPWERWHANPAAQAGPPIAAAPDRRVVELRADAKGRIRLVPWEIPLTDRWANQPVRAFVDGLDVTIFDSDAQIVRRLRIHPERRYQPLTNT